MQPEPSTSDDDIDRKSLRALRERFLGLNRDRLDALRGRLTEEQRTFVDAVPLLLHSNHAALPGFVDFEMPCGIDRYTPDRRALNAVRKMALSFVQERFVERHSQIHAVSVTARPDDALELGVCSAFPTHAALAEKLLRLVRYAADHGVVLTTSLLDPAEEQAGRSRLQMPCLARDAFYRSAILLAGRYPVWWLVPPQLDDAYDAYSARLKSQRFIGRDETFDLGRADPIPRSECLAAGIELIDAALTAPYAHLPSLMLLESYASDSNAAPLAHFYKQRIWNGDTAVDSSMLLDESIAAYLTARGESERLALARDCRRPSSREPTIAELRRENARVNAELQRAHSNLLRLAAEPAGGSADALARLAKTGDQIARLVERRDGTITRINPALRPRRVAGRLRVEPHAHGWQLHDGDAPAFAAPRLVAAIAWAHAHRLGIDNLRPTDARRQACARTLELLSQYDGGKTPVPSTLLLINAEDAPQFALRAPGEAIVSDWDDPLDFSGFHISLVAGVDVLDLREDGIASTGRAGHDGLVDVLVGLLTNPPATLHVHCVGGERDHAIEERVRELVARMSEAFRGTVTRFVFAPADGFVIIERKADRFTARGCSNEPQLFEALASPNRGVLGVDARSARLRTLRDLCSIAVPNQDAVLIHEKRGSVAVLLAMRDGSMHRFIPPPQRLAQEVADDVRELIAKAGLRTDIHLVKANDAPLRVARGEAERVSRNEGRMGSRRDLVALLRDRFTPAAELARRPTVA